MMPSLQRSCLTYEFPAEIHSSTDKVNDHESLYKYSIENRELFWATLARSRLEWFQDFDEITSGDFADPNAHIKWFINGKINVSGALNSLVSFIHQGACNKYLFF